MGRVRCTPGLPVSTVFSPGPIRVSGEEHRCRSGELIMINQRANAAGLADRSELLRTHHRRLVAVTRELAERVAATEEQLTSTPERLAATVPSWRVELTSAAQRARAYAAKLRASTVVRVRP